MWNKRWFYNWLSRWLGGAAETTQPVRRFGRILSTGGILFGDSDNPSAVSSGGVVLARQSSDDYVRFRVPDTNCPPLPQPNTPLDSGIADEAEPARWVVAGAPDTSDRWVLLQSRDTISLHYQVYDGDFLIEATGRVVGWTGAQSGAFFDGVGMEFKLDENNYVIVALGATPGGRGWGIYAIINGNEFKSIGPAVLSDVVFKSQVQRNGANWSARFWRSDTQEWTGWTSIGSVGTGIVSFKLRGTRFNIVPYGSSNRDVTVRVTNITTVSGAPASVTVTTPVVDLQKSVKCTVQRVPAIGTLEWRASDTPFQQTDTVPAWSNPDGNYRYWQARVTWTDPNSLLERVEFLTDAQRIMTFRRFRQYWTIWDTTAGRTLRTDDIGVFGTGEQSRVADGYEHESEEERVTTVR